MNRKIFCIPNAKVTLCLKMQNQIKPMYHLFLVCALFNHTFKVEDHLQQRLIIKSALCSMYNHEFIGFSIVMEQLWSDLMAPVVNMIKNGCKK